ncbi:MAG: OadG family protein [Clostridia bacterium]|nr:OadG family protein [Clostridia bacterium]
MTISLQAAEQIGNVTVFGFGFGLVFVGLICIIAICSIVGSICKAFIKEEKKPAQVPATAPAAAPADNGIANKGEFVAAVSAALAEELGTDVTGIRILSIKKL